MLILEVYNKGTRKLLKNRSPTTFKRFRISEEQGKNGKNRQEWPICAKWCKSGKSGHHIWSQAFHEYSFVAAAAGFIPGNVHEPLSTNSYR